MAPSSSSVPNTRTRTWKWSNDPLYEEKKQGPISSETVTPYSWRYSGRVQTGPTPVAQPPRVAPMFLVATLMPAPPLYEGGRLSSDSFLAARARGSQSSRGQGAAAEPPSRRDRRPLTPAGVKW